MPCQLLGTWNPSGRIYVETAAGMQFTSGGTEEEGVQSNQAIIEQGGCPESKWGRASKGSSFWCQTGRVAARCVGGGLFACVRQRVCGGGVGA